MSRRTRSALRKAIHPVIENLEYRRLFTTVSVTGTSANDTINAYLSGANLIVELNAVQIRNVALSTVTGLSFGAGAGNDTIIVGAGINKPSTLYGGSGNDTITAGDVADTIYGNTGNDSIVSGG